MFPSLSAAVGIHRAQRPQVIPIQRPDPISIGRDLSFGGLVEDNLDVVALVEMHRINEAHLPVVVGEN